MKTSIYLLLFLAFISCDKKEPNVTLIGNKTMASPGEEIEFTLTSSDNRLLKVLTVDAVLFKNNEIHNTGRIFFNDEKPKVADAKFSFTVPYEYFGDSLIEEDYYEFWAYAEDRRNKKLVKYRVDINL